MIVGNNGRDSLDRATDLKMVIDVRSQQVTDGEEMTMTGRENALGMIEINNAS